MKTLKTLALTTAALITASCISYTVLTTLLVAAPILTVTAVFVLTGTAYAIAADCM